MRKLQLYEKKWEAEKDNLPLPNMDLAWQQMEQLLNKEKDDKPFVPPPFFNWGCLLWLLPIIMVGGLGFWFFNAKKQEDNAINKLESNKNFKTKDAINNSKQQEDIVKIEPNIPQVNDALSNRLKNEMENANWENRKKDFKKDIIAVDANTQLTKTNIVGNKDKLGGQKDLSNRVFVNKNIIRNKAKEADVIKNNPTNTKTKVNKNTTSDDYNSPIRGENSAYTKILKNEKAKSDSAKLAAEKIDSIKNAQIKLLNLNVKTISKNKRNFYFGAGLNLYQPLPLKGILSNNFNYYGRQNGIADYLPSVNFRLYRNEKWFINLEARYGAPQNIKPFVFLSTTKIDTGGAILPSIAFANYTLQRTFYHQLSISYHYNITPKISIGTGITYNNFFGAIAQKTGRVVTQGRRDSIIPKTILGSYPNPDTSFNKSSYQALAEIQYRRKNWTLGLKYTTGLTPYIKYYDEVQRSMVRKKHENLNLILRYELWNNKKKK